MPSRQPAGTIKRQPLVTTGSSSSSLSGLEQSIPSFRNFVKRMPPPDQQKPLPPTPLVPRRTSSTLPPRPRTPSLYGRRRSSSVYSRTVSQWGPNAPSWTSADLADEPIPPMPFVQPLAYSASTPQLVEKQATPPLPQPRTYSPLIHTPSPTASRVTTPSRSPEPERSVLLPTPPASVKIPKKHLRTVSLEKAKAALNAPGAVHLLPEELRAQTLAKSRSQEPVRITSPIRIASLDFFAAKTPPSDVLGFPTLVDNQGRHRSVLSPRDGSESKVEYPFSATHVETIAFESSFGLGKCLDNLKSSPANQLRFASKAESLQAPSSSDDEPRGRTRYRGQESIDNSPNVPKNKRRSQEEPAAQYMAEEYHSLLTEPSRQLSDSPSGHGTDSDESIRAHMKLVPRPLFQTKPPARLPGSMTADFLGYVSRRESRKSVSPYRLSSPSSTDRTSEGRSSGSRVGSFPPRISLTPESMHRRRSTTGSIPISPPMDTTPIPPLQSPKTMAQTRKKAPAAKRSSDDNRVSAYYPHVARRKRKKNKDKENTSGSQAPPIPLLSTDIIAQRLETFEDTTDSSPMRSSPAISDLGSLRSDNKANSDKARKPLYRRLAKGAAKYTYLLKKPESPHRRPYEPITAATVSPGSPHLLPSPAKAPPARIHLGWSDLAKSTFDKARSSVQSPNRSSPQPETPRYLHVAASARPLDESRAGLSQPDSPRRKGSIFGSMLDGWKESKAEKRRDELKKIIKVVPRAEGAGAGGNSKQGPMERRKSTFGWM